MLLPFSETVSIMRWLDVIMWGMPYESFETFNPEAITVPIAEALMASRRETSWTLLDHVCVVLCMRQLLGPTLCNTLCMMDPRNRSSTALGVR